jgi:hypothetical protein
VDSRSSSVTALEPFGFSAVTRQLDEYIATHAATQIYFTKVRFNLYIVAIFVTISTPKTITNEAPVSRNGWYHPKNKLAVKKQIQKIIFQKL